MQATTGGIPYPREYVAVAVPPRGHLRVAHIRDGVAVSRSLVVDWAELLRRRKPWQQPGPVLIYPVVL